MIFTTAINQNDRNYLIFDGLAIDLNVAIEAVNDDYVDTKAIIRTAKCLKGYETQIDEAKARELAAAAVEALKSNSEVAAEVAVLANVYSDAGIKASSAKIVELLNA